MIVLWYVLLSFTIYIHDITSRLSFSSIYLHSLFKSPIQNLYFIFFRLPFPSSGLRFFNKNEADSNSPSIFGNLDLFIYLPIFSILQISITCLS